MKTVHQESIEQELIELGVYPGFAQWLSKMELPYFRKRAQKRSMWPRIEIGGDSMRIGKSTAGRVLGDLLGRRGLPVVVSDEDWRSNPHLQASYRDLSEELLASQQWFAQRKLEQLQQAPKDAIFIQCVHPEMDFCYAATNVLLGRLTIKQFEIYRQFYQQLAWDSVALPDLLVYITASNEVMVKRALKSKRDFETVQDNYFTIMKRVNQRWLEKGKTLMPVLEVNTDKFDFSKPGLKQEEFVEMVVLALSQNNWKIK